MVRKRALRGNILDRMGSYSETEEKGICVVMLAGKD